MENTKPSLFDIQSHCESRGYKCSGKIENRKFRMILHINGKLEREGELIEFHQIPEKMAEKYRAIYEYLIMKEFEANY